MRFKYIRLMLKTSIFYFIIGVLIGLLMYLSYWFNELSWAYALRAVHTHIILVGFVIQMIMGVALWMFPSVPSQEKTIEKRLTPESHGIRLYVIFNSGVVLRSVFEPFARSSSIAFYLGLAGVILQIIGIIYFAFLIFPRIRGPLPAK